MNFIAWIILSALAGEAVLHIIADILNLREMKNRPHALFEDVFDADRYKKSQEYLRVNTRYGWFVTMFDLSVFLFFWHAGGFPLLDAWARSFSSGPVVTGVIFIGTLLVCKSLIDLPLEIYRTFVIESRFGFNKTTLKTFVLDRIKGFFLSILIGVPLLAGIIAFFEYAGPHAWWICWAAFTIYLISFQFIAPTWILPLFNRFTPLEESPLRSAIFSYAEKVSYPLKHIFIVDGSRRSSKSNAYFTGFGKNRRIALFDTLVAKHTVPELVAVLAHEIGHFQKKHISRGMLEGILQAGLIFFLLSFFLTDQRLFEAFYMTNSSVWAGILFFGILFSPIAFFLGLYTGARSRKHEFEADRFAAETTGNPEALIDALKKLSAENLTNLSPHPFYVILNDSHPPVLRRIEALKNLPEKG